MCEIKFYRIFLHYDVTLVAAITMNLNQLLLKLTYLNPGITDKGL